MQSDVRASRKEDSEAPPTHRIQEVCNDEGRKGMKKKIEVRLCG
jgi:hypothetical protein